MLLTQKNGFLLNLYMIKIKDLFFGWWFDLDVRSRYCSMDVKKILFSLMQHDTFTFYSRFDRLTYTNQQFIFSNFVCSDLIDSAEMLPYTCTQSFSTFSAKFKVNTFKSSQFLQAKAYHLQEAWGFFISILNHLVLQACAVFEVFELN